jgi:outer membrane protein assembly factor BamB
MMLMGSTDRVRAFRLMAAAACLLTVYPACLREAAPNVESREIPEADWWPMYLGGPSRNAVVRSKNIVISTRPRLVWQKNCVNFNDCSQQNAKVTGPGTPFIGGILLVFVWGGTKFLPDSSRSVVVAEGMVFHVRETAFALDLQDGSTRWSFRTGPYWSWLQSPIYLAGSLLIVNSDGIFAGRINARDPKQWVYWRNKGQDRTAVNDRGPFSAMGAPVVVRGRLFAYMPYDENVRVVDAATGETVCTTEPVEVISSYDPNAKCYPVGIASDERLLFAVLGSGKIIAVDPLSCAVVWSVDGPVCSLPVYSNGVVFVRDNSTRLGVFISIDASTGRVLWQQKPNPDFEDVSFSSPLVVSSGQLLVTATRRLGTETSRDELLAFDASTGEALWTMNLGTDSGAGYPHRPWDSLTPPLVHSTFAYIGVADELVGVDLLARKVAWREKLSCGVAQALAMGEGLLFVSDICGNLYAYGPSTGK